MFGKKSGDASIPDTVDAASTGSQGYPRDFAVSSLRERRLLISLRIVTISLVMSIILSTVLAFILVSLLPLKEVRPFLVQVADQGSIVASIRPIQDTFDAKDVLTEKLVREYVTIRNEVVRSDDVMRDRWSKSGYLGSMTDGAEYSRFVNRVASKLEDIRRLDGQTRVEILGVSAVRTGKVYVVDYRLTSYDARDEIVDERVYTATIEIAFRSISGLTKDEMLMNPTGFTVLSHTIAEKNQ